MPTARCSRLIAKGIYNRLVIIMTHSAATYNHIIVFMYHTMISYITYDNRSVYDTYTSAYD